MAGRNTGSKGMRALDLHTEVATVQVEGLPPEVDEDYRRAVERHRRKAIRYLNSGNPSKGFGELARASRAGPMTPRLAAYLAALGPSLGNISGARRLLESGADDVLGRDRAKIQMRLVRLLRRTQQEPRARSTLRQVLDESPQQMGAHRLLQAFLFKAEDWEGVDAALAAQVTVSEQAQRPRLAARLESARGRLWSGPGADAARAARAYERAAERYGFASDWSAALGAGLRRLEALEEGAGPRENVLAAVQAALSLAERAGDKAQESALRRKLPAPPQRRRSTNTQLMLQMLARGDAMDADAYAALAGLYAREGDTTRADQMEEVAVALRGKSRSAQPPVPVLYLTPADRMGLLHPHLRNAAGELLGIVGPALCQVTYLPPSRSLSPFRVTAGKGSPAVAEALLAAVRILGMAAPNLRIASKQETPLLPDFQDGAPQVLIGQSAIRRLRSEASLRFYAGRALFGQSPELLCLLLAEPLPLERGFELLGAALADTTRLSREARGMSQLLSAKGRDSLREQHARATSNLNVSELKAGALHSANRAGLVLCGGLGPALAALREMEATKLEEEELVRFAASARYLALRTRSEAQARPQGDATS